MKIDKEEATKLYLDGLLDTEIAKHLNCSKTTIQQWRQRNNLKSNSVIAQNKNNLVNHERITKLWENGLKDSEIAKELKCSAISVWKFREKNGMGSNVGLFDWEERKANGKAKRL